VEKNHFLFYADRNLLVYQRNSSGSHYSRFQRYAKLSTGANIAFEPILTTDAYARLLNGADARVIDVSFQQPKDPAMYKDMFMSDAVKLVKKVGGSTRTSASASVARIRSCRTTSRTLPSRSRNSVWRRSPV
jgi:hypothetical protein